MNVANHVIVFGGGPGLCDRAHHFGALITLVDTPSGYDPALVASVHRTFLTRYDDPALLPALQALHVQQPFSAVLCMTELGLLPAARVAAELGLPGVSPEAVERTRDKLVMREWLQQQGFSKVPCSRAGSTQDVRTFAQAYGYPVIVKPRSGQGSQSIMRFDSLEQLGECPLSEQDYIVESFLAGPEFSVEAFSFGGCHMIAAVTGKLTNKGDQHNPFVEIGHVVPAPITSEERHIIEDYVTRFLTVMQISDGCSHTEIRLTATGPEVIETHTRVGGDSIPTLVRQATGCDLLDLAVQWPLGLIEPMEALSTNCAAAIRFFTPKPGKVKAITGVHRWRGTPGVLNLHLPLKEGEVVGETRDSFSRSGYVLATAPTPCQALELCDTVINGIVIDIE
ncbi:ATP-grasp domain-containing protein [Pseudomonas cucumis]|uniref:ATP-grasp domain-containing protein n=1 Tax=Pseudomonas cucumis TaxID=2954082 RepID=A0ABY9EYZ6_9PSED|nr:ATP-grasp domain-containing protein [Pseudomonas cucumis]WLG85679.1 ATP-grasp domain-containing protein [Pseudomonas cucumis]